MDTDMSTNEPPIVTIPDFLLDEQTVAQRSMTAIKELTEKQYEIAFEHILEQLTDGLTLTDILREYHTPIKPHKLRTWIVNDKNRLKRYDDAMAIGTRAIEDEFLNIADAKNDSLEDVQRTKVRLDARKWILQVRNRNRYGNDAIPNNPFSGGVNIVIAGVTSPYQLETTPIDGEVIPNE